MSGDEAGGARDGLFGSASVLVSLPVLVSWPQFVHLSLTAPVLTLGLGRDRCPLHHMELRPSPPVVFLLLSYVFLHSGRGRHAFKVGVTDFGVSQIPWRLCLSLVST